MEEVKCKVPSLFVLPVSFLTGRAVFLVNSQEQWRVVKNAEVACFYYSCTCVRRTVGPEAWDWPVPSHCLQEYSEQSVGLGGTMPPMGKHVAIEALCSPATFGVLDEFPAVLVVLVGTILQA